MQVLSFTLRENSSCPWLSFPGAGQYVAVEPFHLDHYLSEQVFRFNNRATKDNPLTDADRFALAVSQVAGKRLTYKELTGKTQSGQL